MERSRFILGHLLVMGVLVFLLIAGVMFWLEKYTRQGEVAIVPEIKGKTVAYAERLLHWKGLEYQVADSNYIADQLPGSVLESTPSEGQTVKKGRIIYLTINKENVPEYPIPDVADNSSVRQAEAKITAAGFKLTEHKLIAGEKDWVYGVIYKGRPLAPGEKVPMGTTLTLMVGSGQSQEQMDLMEGYDPDTEEDEDAELYN
ncbi:Serine/threonine-protein kinase PK-1 [termite gut metagenome]|uniref:Serine/threonine-protein kinase PK-1 n=1 Tax=termite gut metagenome TaxID=433724 RepID=A0A5J4S0U2_9ZZZZ